MKTVRLFVDGEEIEAPQGSSVATALLTEGIRAFRKSISGEPRGPICAMGICFECRVTIDGIPHRRACMELCREGMEVRTGE